MAKRISTEAFQALRDALAVVFWYKRPFQTFLRTALRDRPELVAGLDFSDTKRVVADDLVGRLVEHEHRYQDVAIRLMLEIAAMTRFPDIESLAEPDRSTRLGEARDAVAQMKVITETFAERIAEQDREQAERDANKAQLPPFASFRTTSPLSATASLPSSRRPTIGGVGTTSSICSPTSSESSIWNLGSATSPRRSKLTAR
jgi:hypothetical protein